MGNDKRWDVAGDLIVKKTKRSSIGLRGEVGSEWGKSPEWFAGVNAEWRW